MIDVNILVQNAVPLALYVFAILGAIVCLIQKDLNLLIDKKAIK